MERSCVHDVAPGDAVLSTLPGRVEAKLQWSKVLLHSPQPSGSLPAYQMDIVFVTNYH